MNISFRCLGEQRRISTGLSWPCLPVTALWISLESHHSTTRLSYDAPFRPAPLLNPLTSRHTSTRHEKINFLLRFSQPILSQVQLFYKDTTTPTEFFNIFTTGRSYHHFTLSVTKKLGKTRRKYQLDKLTPTKIMYLLLQWTTIIYLQHKYSTLLEK